MSPKEVKTLFRENGESVGQWADRNGFDRALVYRVLNGQSACLRGKSHQAAVALGIKNIKRSLPPSLASFAGQSQTQTL